MSGSGKAKAQRLLLKSGPINLPGRKSKKSKVYNLKWFTKFTRTNIIGRKYCSELVKTQAKIVHVFRSQRKKNEKPDSFIVKIKDGTEYRSNRAHLKPLITEY